MTVIEPVLPLAAILASAALFANAVEIFGERLNLGVGAVGSVLAAVGTALLETLIPSIAILGAVFAGRDPEAAGEIGTGAILGAPFLLTTLTMLVVGVSAYLYRRRPRDRFNVNTKVTVAKVSCRSPARICGAYGVQNRPDGIWERVSPGSGHPCPGEG